MKKFYLHSSIEPQVIGIRRKKFHEIRFTNIPFRQVGSTQRSPQTWLMDSDSTVSVFVNLAVLGNLTFRHLSLPLLPPFVTVSDESE